MPKTILIVEDHPSNMSLLNDILQAHDYNTVLSVDGSDCMQLVREHRPDLILMDIQLPQVSGVDITIALKADSELKDIPVIAVTAFAMKGDDKKFLAAGCDDYISKPIDMPLFLATVAKHLGLSEPEPTTA